MGDYRERIAAVQHEIWSHWMRYLFSVCTLDSLGNVFIPVEKVRRWQRQMNTDYADLSGAEQESDRHQADKVLAERDAEIAQLKAQVAELQRWRDAVPVDAIAFLVGATEANLGDGWQTRTVTEWANKMPK